MLRHLILFVCIVLMTAGRPVVVNAQRDNNNNKVLRPQDIFPNDPMYKPSLQNNKVIKNPFSDTYNREDPDQLFKGFFPIWSAILACISVIFGFIAIFGLIGYMTGCRNPNNVLIKQKMKAQQKAKVQVYLHDENEDAALSMLEEKDYEKRFTNSRLDTSYA